MTTGGQLPVTLLRANLLLLAATSTFLCASVASASSPVFTEQTAAAGISFVHGAAFDHRSGPMSGGGCVADFDGNDYPDLYVIGGGEIPDVLYLNNGDGTFTDHAAAWGLDELHRGTGCTTGDYDGDGDTDLYVTSFGSVDALPRTGEHRLYRNDEDSFTDVAHQARVDLVSVEQPDGYGAAFGDYDMDGDLDLFVAGWHGQQVGEAYGSRLFRNDGERFAEVSELAGVLQEGTHAFGGVFADMDGDHWPELIVAGDFGTNRYYRNNRNGTFSELDPGSGALRSGAWTIGEAHNGMGLTVADLNRDGLPDWVLTAIWPSFQYEGAHWGNGLYYNRSRHRYDEDSQAAGINDGGWGWGVAAADFDHDGLVDIAMTNGWPTTDDVTNESFSDEPAYLFRNSGDGTFAETASDSGLVHTQQGRSLLTFDYDRDGDLDVVIFSNRDALRLYRNELISPTGRQRPDVHWLQIELDTRQVPHMAPDGQGASVRIRYGKNERQVAQAIGGGGYLGRSEALLHFGVGSATNITDIVVRWADGSRTALYNLAVDQRIRIVAGSPTGPRQ